MKLNVIIENEGRSWGAYTPDEGFCIIATARSRAAVVRRFQSALAFYLDYLREEGREVPDITELEIHETVPALPAQAA
jgi:predicted RNase H-like HicB family nuclease